MFIVCYDFSCDKTRAKFSKFLCQYGRKIQYSVYEIKNSQRVLQNIIKEVELKYKKQFTNSDSILIFKVCKACNKEVARYGYAANEEVEVVMF